MKRLRLNANVGSKRKNLGMTPTAKRQMNTARRDFAAVVANYTKLVNHLEGVTPEVLYEALQPTFAKSQTLCPVDSGRLRASGYLEITQFRGTPTVEIGYAKGGNPSYAAAVHENLEWRHKAPTRAKWLQIALTQDEAAIQGRIISRLRYAGGF